MAKNRDIITNALKMLGVIGGGAVLSAEDAADALSVMNGIGHGFAAQSIHTGWSDQSLDDPFPLEDKHSHSFTCILAEACAPLFGAAVPPVVAASAFRGRQSIGADYLVIERVSLDGVSVMPSQRRF